MLLVACRALLAGQAAPVWDADSVFAPWQMLIADHARAGRLLLWNPWTNGGQPDFAQPQSGAFSPLAVGVGLLTGGSLLGYHVYWLLIWSLAGLGTLLLGRHLGAPPWGAFLVAVGFQCGGFFTGHASHMPFLVSLAWLPWILWRLDAALLARRLYPAVEAGALLGLSGLGGYPAFVFLHGVYVCLWALGRALCAPPAPPGAGAEAQGRAARAGYALLCVALVGVIAALVIAPTYAAFFSEGAGVSDRVGALPRGTAVTSNALAPGALATFSSPYLQNLWYANHPHLWPYTNPSSASLYLGPLALSLAACALAARSRERWRWWLLGMGATSLAFALGPALPLRGWLYDLLPPTAYFRHSAGARGYTMLSVVVLALLGVRDLQAALATGARAGPDAPPWRRLRLAFLAPALLALLAFGWLMGSVQSRGEQPLVASAHALLAWGAVALLASLGPWAWRRERRRALVGVLVGLAAADAVLAVALAAPLVYTREPSIVAGWRRLERRRSADLDLTPHGLHRIHHARIGPGVTSKNLPVKEPVLMAHSAFINRFHGEWVTGSPALNRVALGGQRIWFAPQAVRVPPTPGAFDAFRRRLDEHGELALLLHAPDELRAAASEVVADATLHAIARAPAARSVAVQVVRYEPNLLELVVDCPAQGWLLVTDRWSRGWRASLNGSPVEVWGGNFLFRAVEVGPGRNELRFHYELFGYPELAVLSWLTLAAVAGTTLRRALRRPA